MDIQKMKELAENADRQVTWSLVPFDMAKDQWEVDVVNYIAEISPQNLKAIINRLEKAEAQLAELPEWTDQQCLEFISIAFRHADISGDIEMDDIRLGMKIVNAGVEHSR